MDWTENYLAICKNLNVDPCPSVGWKQRLLLGQVFPWTRRALRRTAGFTSPTA